MSDGRRTAAKAAAARATRRPALRRLVAGILADVDDYTRLRGLLETQFEATVRHDSARLGAVGADIVAVAQALEGRRAERVALASGLTGIDGAQAMNAVFALLPEAIRAAVVPAWQALEAAVRECKALNARNCRLLMDQYEIMQRVLDVEADTYVPL